MRGFSLVEIIVAVAVFTVVAMLTVGSLFILTSAEKRVASVQANQDNIRFAMESISREIRTGVGISFTSCGASCFSFLVPGGDTLTYDLVGSRIIRQVNTEAAFPITGPEVNIQRLSFYLASDDPSDNVQTHVTIVLTGIAQQGTPNETEMSVQTSITPLKLNE